MLPGFRSVSIDARVLVRDDVESPRRRLESVLKKSDDMEVDLECEEQVGVIGGVRAPLLCKVRGSSAPMVEDRILDGESGGVEMVLEG